MISRNCPSVNIRIFAVCLSIRLAYWVHICILTQFFYAARQSKALFMDIKNINTTRGSPINANSMNYMSPLTELAALGWKDSLKAVTWEFIGLCLVAMLSILAVPRNTRPFNQRRQRHNFSDDSHSCTPIDCYTFMCPQSPSMPASPMPSDESKPLKQEQKPGWGKIQYKNRNKFKLNRLNSIITILSLLTLIKFNSIF